MNRNPDKSPNALLQKDPGLVGAEIESLLSGDSALSQADCHALAEGSAFKAVSSLLAGRNDEARQWAEIALKTYEALSAKALDSSPENPAKSMKFLASAMNLRSEFIGRLGDVADDFILDPQRLKSWFMGNLEMDFATANELARKWKSLPPAEIHKLRTIKNRLKAMHSAMSRGTLRDDEDLLAWKGLERDLP